MVTKTISILVSGKVQHVGYRYSAQKIAIELGLEGIVKNLPDGNVYIEAKGSEDNLAKFEKWCLSGPPLARVQKIIVEEIFNRAFNSFEITVW